MERMSNAPQEKVQSDEFEYEFGPDKPLFNPRDLELLAKIEASHGTRVAIEVGDAILDVERQSD